MSAIASVQPSDFWRYANLSVKRRMRSGQGKLYTICAMRPNSDGGPYHYTLHMGERRPMISETRKRIKNSTNRIQAILLAVPATPLKPKTAATRETTRKMTAQRNISILLLRFDAWLSYLRLGSFCCERHKTTAKGPSEHPGIRRVSSGITLRAARLAPSGLPISPTRLCGWIPKFATNTS